jgi:hypothetical protein
MSLNRSHGMIALARRAERCLDLFLARGNGPTPLSRIAVLLAALTVVAAAVWIAYLRTAYQSQLGP